MWIIAPLTPGACRADREWHRREVAALEHELRNIWTNVCLVTHLAQVMPPPGAILQAPTIGRITLDDAPARFSVKLRAGQLPIDFERRAERFAAAFRVPKVEIRPLTADRQWISVDLLEPYWIEYPDEYVVAAGEDRTVVDGIPDAEELEPAERVRVVDVEPVPTTRGGSFRRFWGDLWRVPTSDRVEPAN
ncbi:hypothetical protein [Actinomycetospora sp. CA-084318]|uniref:hypothetical protein n=1 Tax=Actinomycetospora sp. CA-084318 TaxID=3239892 RepID=UPI003D985F58